MEYHYDNVLERLNLLTLHNRRRHIDALFLINAFSAIKCCASVLEMVGFRMPPRNIRNLTYLLSLLVIALPRCISTANLVCKLTNILGILFRV
jgi:hypothetical protein